MKHSSFIRGKFSIFSKLGHVRRETGGLHQGRVIRQDFEAEDGVRELEAQDLGRRHVASLLPPAMGMDSGGLSSVRLCGMCGL